MNTCPLKGTVEFDHVSKRYQLGSFGTLRGVISTLLSKDSDADNWQRTLWALRDVTFQVKHGESLGVIGPNGAGKTTSLKLLSNITKPTTGRATAYGRVSSLIELGAGFHPELTGRENIFLNGAILGLNRREIAHKLDAIVAFSELERFIDTPVKRYSSGMYVRLGFAVAAHVEPDILLIDEVLAVGDTTFRQKCMAHMEELRRTGITILFVSHNMHMVRRLCDRTLLLWEGRLCYDGSPDEALSTYEQMSQQRSVRDITAQSTSENTRVVISEINILNKHLVPQQNFHHGESLEIVAHYIASSPIVSPVVRIRLIASSGAVLAMVSTHHLRGVDSWVLKERGVISLTIPSIEVVSGTYSIELRVMDITDTELLAGGYSEQFYVESPGFAYEIDRGSYMPKVIWHLPTGNGRS
jgi:lipopolysaccharide transport system ATP-binding protein